MDIITVSVGDKPNVDDIKLCFGVFYTGFQSTSIHSIFSACKIANKLEIIIFSPGNRLVSWRSEAREYYPEGEIQDLGTPRRELVPLTPKDAQPWEYLI